VSASDISGEEAWQVYKAYVRVPREGFGRMEEIIACDGGAWRAAVLCCGEIFCRRVF
jgi:hypothetical protein